MLLAKQIHRNYRQSLPAMTNATEEKSLNLQGEILFIIIILSSRRTAKWAVFFVIEKQSDSSNIYLTCFFLCIGYYVDLY